MSYPVQHQLNTLTAALENVSAQGQNLPIAPELMGDEGLPPQRDPSTPGYPAYSNPSLRQAEGGIVGGMNEGSDWGYESRNVHDPIWDSQGYSTGTYQNNSNPNSNLNDGTIPLPMSIPGTSYHNQPHNTDLASENGKNTGVGTSTSTNTNTERKRKRTRAPLSDPTNPDSNSTSKSRSNTKSRNGHDLQHPLFNGDETQDPFQGQNIEYESPLKDIRLGAVFVHPPKGSAQACVRCHRIKRKCEGGKPRCQGCTKADVACVFELSPATSG
jgi:hypothetical protein